MKADKGAMRFKIFIVSVRENVRRARIAKVQKGKMMMSVERKICPSPFVEARGVSDPRENNKGGGGGGGGPHLPRPSRLPAARDHCLCPGQKRKPSFERYNERA